MLFRLRLIGQPWLPPHSTMQLEYYRLQPLIWWDVPQREGQAKQTKVLKHSQDWYRNSYIKCLICFLWAPSSTHPGALNLKTHHYINWIINIQHFRLFQFLESLSRRWIPLSYLYGRYVAVSSSQNPPTYTLYYMSLIHTKSQLCVTNQ